MTECSNCHAKNRPDAQYCPICGIRLNISNFMGAQAKMKRCSNCRALNRLEATYCHDCGLPWPAQQQRPRAARIFVSHNKDDTIWCRDFVRTLREHADADVWWDEDNLHAGNVVGELGKELYAHSIVIVVLSPNAVTSGWVALEANTAISLSVEDDQRVVLPVVAEHIDIRELKEKLTVLSSFVRICGPDNSGLEPVEAARRAIRKLSLVSPSERAVLVPLASSETKVDARVRGSGLYAQARYPEALAAYGRALNMDITYALAWSNEGNTLHILQRYPEAMDAYQHALQLAPESLATWINKGIALIDQGRYGEARDAYEHALALAPKNPFASRRIGDELTLLKPSEDAQAIQNQTIKSGSPDANRFLDQGNTYYGLNRYEEALAAYEQAVKLSPQDANIWTNIGNVLIQLMRYDEALAAFDWALQLNPRGISALSGKAVALHNMNRHHESKLARCELTILQDPQNAAAWQGKSQALRALGRYAEALTAADQALHFDPQLAAAWCDKGYALSELNRYDEALGAQNCALALDPQYVRALNGKALACWNLKRYEETLAIYDQVLALNPKDAVIWNLKAKVLRALRRDTEALQAEQQRDILQSR